MNQHHLSHKKQVDFGSFYTPKNLVDLVYEMIAKNVSDFAKNCTILDSSCGYGSFLTGKFADKISRKIGADIDEKAILEAEKLSRNTEFFATNSLQNISRKNYKIRENEKLIIVGNPPYNDTTSIIRQNIKDKNLANKIDGDVRTRDLGMSFLLSYDKLKANYICVLHPLSYLIKKANFASLKNFAQNYKLIDGIVVSSHEFSETSRNMAFPILIGFYKRGEKMDYNFIKNFAFKIKDDGTFRLKDFDSIANYITKYPNKKSRNSVAKFYTMRDINALKRSRTFIENDMTNTVYVDRENLSYYCYVDIFKNFVADKLPFYFGNLDVPIDNENFAKIKEDFIAESVRTNPILAKQIKFREIPNAREKIANYFNEFLGEKYVANHN